MANKTKINWKPHNPCEFCIDLIPCERCSAIKNYKQNIAIIQNILQYLVKTTEDDTIPVTKLKSMLKEIRRR